MRNGNKTNNRSSFVSFLRTPFRRVLGVLAVALLLASTPVLAQEDPSVFASPPADAVKSLTGLASKVLVEGTGERKPDDHDKVAVHFIARTPDGKIFRNTYDTGQPLVFNLQNVFPGWREGLQQMVVGEKRRIWIPGHLAPQNPSSGPSGAVVFDAELTGILDLPEPPTQINPPPSDAKQTPAGSYSKVMKAGTGDKKPTLEDSALLHFTLWDEKGTLLDTSIERRRPTMFPLERVLYPFAECVMQMVVGETRRCWIPADLAAGQWPGAPKGSLVFELELVQFANTADLMNDAGVDLPATSAEPPGSAQ